MYENGDGQLHLSISTPWVDIRRPVQATYLKGTLYILEAQTIRKWMWWWVTLADLILRNGSFLHSSSFLCQPWVLVCLWLLKHVGDKHLAFDLYTGQFSQSGVSDSLWPHELQHASLPCPSPAPGVYSNSCPSSQWCHPTISSSVIPFSSHLKSFLASGSFPMNQFFTSGGQSIGVSASASVLPMNMQDWFPLGWMVGSPCSPRDSQKSCPTPQFKSIKSSALCFLYSPTLTSICDYWKNHHFD